MLLVVSKNSRQEHDFLQVYTGGIGSYALFVMVAAFLLLHPSRTPKREGSRHAGDHMLACAVTCRQEKNRKDYTFWRHFNVKPSILPGCAVL